MQIIHSTQSPLVIDNSWIFVPLVFARAANQSEMGNVRALFNELKFSPLVVHSFKDECALLALVFVVLRSCILDFHLSLEQ